jgi:hypothetical protein
MRNWHFRDSWLRAVARGCEIAQEDLDFARTAGACFGGLEIYPASVLGEMWQKTVSELIGLLPLRLLASLESKPNPMLSAARDWFSWQAGWWASLTDDPIWHANWQSDVQRKWLNTISLIGASTGDPRAQGLV